MRLTRFLLNGVRTHYQVLGVAQAASANEIKEAYYRLSKQYHPDLSQDEKSASLFRELTEAYDILSNQEKRNVYDVSISLDKQQFFVSPAPKPTIDRDDYTSYYRNRRQQMAKERLSQQQQKIRFEENNSSMSKKRGPIEKDDSQDTFTYAKRIEEYRTHEWGSHTISIIFASLGIIPIWYVIHYLKADEKDLKPFN